MNEDRFQTILFSAENVNGEKFDTYWVEIKKLLPIQ
jgi:hypothetical protein